MTIDRRVEVIERRLVFDGFFKLVHYRLRHRLFDGGMSPALDRELFDRGHAAVVLPYDPVREEVVLVEQFRLGALEPEGDPWLLEPVAGIMEDGEQADEVARRETLEEAGLVILDLQPVCSSFMSPGGSSEVVHTYVGRVETAGDGGLFGLADEGEDIKVHVLPYARALAWLDQGRFQVASTLLAMQWLARHHDTLRARWLGIGGAGA